MRVGEGSLANLMLPHLQLPLHFFQLGLRFLLCSSGLLNLSFQGSSTHALLILPLLCLI